MKTLLFIAALIIISTAAIFGQAKGKAKTKAEVLFCNTSSKYSKFTMKYADLGKCNELLTIDKKLKIKKFNLSYKDGSGFVDMGNTGSKFNKEIRDFLKTCEARKINRIIIETTAFDGAAEKKLSVLDISFIK